MLQKLKTFLKVEAIRRRFLRHSKRGYVDLTMAEVEWITNAYESIRYFLTVTIGWYVVVNKVEVTEKGMRCYYKMT